MDNSLDQSIDSVVKRYSSLFVLPSYSKSLLLLALTCISGGILSVILLSSHLQAMASGLLLGFSLLLVNSIFDYIVTTLVLRKDSIYDLRRITALSLFSWVLWLFFIFIGVVGSMAFGFLWEVKSILFGFSAVLILRLTALNSTTSVSSEQLLTASALQPLTCMILFLLFWPAVNYFHISLFIICSLVISFLSTSFLIYVVNHIGDRTLGIASLSLFKAFLLNWIVGLNAPFEEFLEDLGREQDVEISLVKFDATKPKAIMAVPSIHPGPFKNVGSSLLPSMIKNAIEKKLNCVASVPHGLLGHELDLSSHHQNERVINHIVSSVNFDASIAKATPFLKFSNGIATACCQLFGKNAFLSFTLAPHTTEDLPQELEHFVHEEAEKHGLNNSIVVNAHNSINGKVNAQKAVDSLKSAAVQCLEKASSSTRLPFKVGAASVLPEEFSLKEGMGPGGITVVVIEVGKQKIAYVVIDGNNMVSGLREKLLSALQSEGISDGEILTTDTHSVNALILTGRGYHPIGEAIRHERLIDCIKEATSAALSNLESAKVDVRRITVSKVKVIGEEKLEALCLLAERTIRKAKQISVPLFITTGLLLVFLLMLL